MIELYGKEVFVMALEHTPEVIRAFYVIMTIGILSIVSLIICYYNEERIKGCKKCGNYNHQFHSCRIKMKERKISIEDEIKCLSHN